MIFLKKMCVLRQIRPGFSGDGKQAGGVVKAEQYGKNLSVEVSVIGFAPLAAGEYYALIADSADRTELLPLRGKSLFNLISDLDIAEGFCAVICLVKNGVTPLAYGVSGNKEYDFDKLIASAAAPKEKTGFHIAAADAAGAGLAADTGADMSESAGESAGKSAGKSAGADKYNDESIAERDYYKEEERNERGTIIERDENAGVAAENAAESGQAGQAAATNENAENIRKPLNENGDEYYRSVKDELDELFKKYEKDETLKSTFPCSEWVKIKEPDKAEYLVGVIYEEAAPLYICYAFPAADKDDPPEEIAETCAFVPISPFGGAKGCFVIFQSTATGECVKLKEA